MENELTIFLHTPSARLQRASSLIALVMEGLSYDRNMKVWANLEFFQH